jgi:hypothetical protein
MGYGPCRSIELLIANKADFVFVYGKSYSTVYNPSENFKWHNSFEDHQGNISTKFLSNCQMVCVKKLMDADLK